MDSRPDPNVSFILLFSSIIVHDMSYSMLVVYSSGIVQTVLTSDDIMPLITFLIQVMITFKNVMVFYRTSQLSGYKSFTKDV